MADLQNLKDKLNQVSSRISEIIGERSRLSNASSDLPNIGAPWFSSKIDELIALCDSYHYEESEDFFKTIDYDCESLDLWLEKANNYLLNNNGNAIYSYRTCSNFAFIIEDIKFDLEHFSEKSQVDEAKKQYKKTLQALEGLSKEIDLQNEKCKELSAIVRDILSAKEAADTLPATKSSLETAQKEAIEKLESIEKNFNKANEANAFITSISQDIEKLKAEINTVLNRSNEALRTSTSAGLAGAFYKKVKKLECSSRWWVGGFVASLVTILGVGLWRLISVLDMLNRVDAKIEIVILNMVLSALTLGAPIWFAWLASKRISFLFKLVEDYEFKASTSTAYEGFRREAGSHDKAMESKVLLSALDRFDEPPLRFVDEKVFGSPWQELIQSPEFREAIKKKSFLKEVMEKAKALVSGQDVVKEDNSIAKEKSTDDVE